MVPSFHAVSAPSPCLIVWSLCCSCSFAPFILNILSDWQLRLCSQTSNQSVQSGPIGEDMQLVLQKAKKRQTHSKAAAYSCSFPWFCRGKAFIFFCRWKRTAKFFKNFVGVQYTVRFRMLLEFWFNCTSSYTFSSISDREGYSCNFESPLYATPRRLSHENLSLCDDREKNQSLSHCYERKNKMNGKVVQFWIEQEEMVKNWFRRDQ